MCPDCRYISVTFDPFMSLSVPLPTIKDKVQRVIVVYNQKPPEMMGPEVGCVVQWFLRFLISCDVLWCCS